MVDIEICWFTRSYTTLGPHTDVAQNVLEEIILRVWLKVMRMIPAIDQFIDFTT